jgi:NAD(P)H-nitrite reductase large subunit
MKHLIIGTGPAGVTAAEELRRLDASAEIAMIGHEPEPPYSRMAIPYLIKNAIEESGTYMRISESHFADQKIAVINAEVSSIKPTEKQVVLSDGETLKYDKLLIASGGTPLTPPIEGIDLPGVHPCWTLENARDIMARAVPESHIVLIGAGFISTTIVEALVERGGTLTIIEMEDRLIPRMMDAKGADIIQKWCEDKGVNILTSARVESIAEVGDKLAVSFAGHEAIEADLVISATGVKPNTDFLEGVDIEVDHGIVVDEFLMSSDPNIYAAGDVAQAPDLLTKDKTVMAIQPVAAEHGKLVAHNMTKGNSLQWRGSINMNVLDMLGLVSCSFGLWEGIEGGDSGELHKPEQNKYIQLQFDEDRLIGASSVGYTEHVGIFQGLIQGKVALGEWKQKLIDDPNQVMKAWIGVTQGMA